MLNGKLNGKLSSIIWAFPRLRRGRAAPGSAIASASPGGESAPAAAGAPSASLTRSRRAEKTARPALALIAALLLSGCPGDLLKQMDNPRDPQAPSYQGFSTVKAVDDLEAHTPDGAKLMFQTFTVSEVLDADAYQLQISTESGFSVPLYDNDSLDSNVMKGWASLTEETSYYWRGRAKKDGRWGPWTGARAFVFSAMSGLSPASGSSTTDTTPTLSWDAVPGAAGYEVQIADSEARVASATAVEVSETSYTPTTALVNKQTHYWRVRAKNGDGQYGAWSAVLTLAVNIGAVTGLSPSSTADTTPALSWNAVPGAAGYEVQIAASEAGLANAQAVEVSGTSYTPATALTNNQPHYWRVRAKDGDEQYGTWSAVAAIAIGYFVGGFGPAEGIVFYDKGSYSDGWRYLEAAKSDQATRVEWGVRGTSVGGTSTGIGSGKANTEKIVNKLGSGNYAVRICYDLVLGGYDDWFLPSRDELYELYKQKDTVGSFASDIYWSSSEYGSNYAWGQGFYSGGQYGDDKSLDVHVRAVRAF